MAGLVIKKHNTDMARTQSIAASGTRFPSDDEMYSLVSKKAEIVFNSLPGGWFYTVDDLASESAVKVWKSFGRFEATKAPLDAWVYYIVKNTWLDMLDKEKTMRNHFSPLELTNDEGEEYDAEESGHSCGYGYDDFGTCAEVESEEETDYILSTVKSIPNDFQRQSMELSIEGYDNAEIAERLGCSKGNVAVYLCKARKAVANRLPEAYHANRGRSGE